MGGAGKPPLVILHGILGSSRNWAGAGPRLAEHFEVHALDLPSHGQSPHMDAMTFETMAQQVAKWIDACDLGPVILLGHSLGGKVAMTLASISPDWLVRLIIADIAPRDYSPHSLEAIEAMLALDLSALQSRKEAEDGLRQRVPDLGLRRFLLTNLVRGEDQQFRWQANLEAIHQSLSGLGRNPMAQRLPHTGPALFLKGEHSDFVRDRDDAVILQYFPQATIHTIAAAGHNLHFDNLPAFVEAVTGPF